MFSCHLPHTVMFVSCDVFHIVVAVGYSQKGKTKRQKRTFWPNMDKVYTKVHGKCGNMKSQWLFWNQDASETHWGGKGEQTRAEGWETADSDKETRRAYGGKRVGEKKVEMRINSIIFWPFRNSCLTRCCQRNFKHSGIFIIIIKERKSGHADRTRTLKKKEMIFIKFV